MFLDERLVGESDTSTAVARAEVERRIREISITERAGNERSAAAAAERRDETAELKYGKI
jgi:thymidine kinase